MLLNFPKIFKVENSNGLNFLFFILFRINEINKDLEKEIPLLIKSNVISAVGDRKSPMTVADVAVDTDFIDATGAQIPEEFIYTNHGPDYEINEKVFACC